VTQDNTEGWFDDSEKRPGSASAKFKEVGDTVQGEIVDKYLIDYVKVGEKEPEKDNDGNVIKQLVLVLQTDHRNWDAVAKVPTDKDSGKKRPPEDDNGRRAVYFRKFTNIYAALGAAIRESGVENPSKHPQVGGKAVVQFFKEEDTGKPSMLKHFRAKYTPPAPASADDQDWGQPAQGTQSEAQSKNATPSEDEPPF
jgi:hypothetical protein